MKKEKKFVLKRLMPYMEQKKILLPLALILSAISAVLNIIPFVLIWVIVRSILSSGSIVDIQNLSVYAWMAFICAGGGIVLYFLALMSSHLAAFHVEVGIQKIGMKKILNMPLGFFDKYSSGKIRKIINDGASTTHTFLAHQLPDIAGTIISPIILIALIIFVDWRMGIVSLIPIILGFVTMSFMVSSKGKAFQKQYYDSLEEMSSESVEYIRGIPVVKTFGQSIFSFKRFYNSIIKYKDMVYAYTVLWQKPMSFYTVIMETAAFFLVPIGILLIGRSNDLALVLSDFVFYILISPMFTLLLMKSMYFRQNILIAEQAIVRIDNLLEYSTMAYSKISKKIMNYDLEFKNVGFSYAQSDKKAIDNVSFTLKEGQTIAFVGPSGGGKTTIARLAARFWDPDEGEIFVGGVNVKNIPKQELMDTLSFVFQSTNLLKGSLRDNILFGNELDSEITLKNAIKNSQSQEIIDNLVNGLETQIGSQGTHLSGGEQQRIAIARAMVKNAPILLLDEATAFADPENEHLIHKALKELSTGKTTLMIAHRLTTIKDVDKILVIKDSKIVEEGNHKQLLKKKGLYKTMWDEYQQAIDWKITIKKSNMKDGQND